MHPHRFNFQVSSVYLVREGKSYLSQRTRGGLWQNPGGKLDMGEAPRDGAQRELFEETGLLIPLDRIQPLGSKEVPGKSYTVHSFVVLLDEGEEPQRTEPLKNGPWLALSEEQIAKVPTVGLLGRFLAMATAATGVAA